MKSNITFLVGFSIVLGFQPCARADDMVFGSNSAGWHITGNHKSEGERKTDGDGKSALKSSINRSVPDSGQTKNKAAERWVPFNPSFSNGGGNKAGTSLMLQASPSSNKSSPNNFALQTGSEGKAESSSSILESGGVEAIVEQVNRYIKDGNKIKASVFLWDLKWKGKLSPDQEKLVDGMLIQIGDEKALITPLIVANTSDAQVLQGIENMQKSGRISEAIELSKELEKRHPNKAAIPASVAVLYYKSGNISEALSYFRKADEIEPKTSIHLNNVMVCCTQLGLLEDLQAARKAFIQRFPDDSRSADLQKQVDYYQKDFAQTREREKKGSASVSTDSPHFSKNSMPLKVYIPDITAATRSWDCQPDLNIDYVDIMGKATAAWQEASGGRVSFTTTSDADQANIVIEWADDPSGMTHNSAIGATSVIYNSKRLPQHKIALLVPSKKYGGDASVFLATTTHEFGHALGLSHSSDPKDIMYNTSLPDCRLTENDCARISELYK